MDQRAAAMGARDIERVMALYAADVVYFDVVPPLPAPAPLHFDRDPWIGSNAGKVR